MSDPQFTEPVDDSGSLEQVPCGEFVQLFTKSQRRLFLFILAQVSNTTDAEEILQDTNVIIWSKFHKFQLGTSFFAWAGKIATYEILKYRDKKRAGRLVFSDEFISRVADDAIEISDELEKRREALSECLRHLRADDHKLIQARYAPGENGLQLAERLGRPSNSVYQSIGRIRKVLFDCVTRRLTATARTS
ncbi:MAG: sigma-70 family RNA polymerase sigma factor [Planctomycetaceae bacterium]